MAALRKALPVVLCGRTTAVGKPVSEALLPEFEVIRFIQTKERALDELPFSWGPRAVIIGRAFSQEDVEALRDACKGINKDPVAWIVGNPAKKPPAGAPSRLPEYAAAVARDCKDTLTKWVERGASKEELLLF